MKDETETLHVLVQPTPGLNHSGCSDLTLGVGSFLSKVPVPGGGRLGGWLVGWISSIINGSFGVIS